MKALFLLLLVFPLGCGSSDQVPCTNVGAPALLYLDEAGCPTCNRYFSELCVTSLSTPGVDLVLRTSGAQLDIGPFLEADSGRVRWDDDGRLQHCLGLTGSSAVFFTTDGSVDTIVRIEARTLDQDLAYIGSRLPRP